MEKLLELLNEYVKELWIWDYVWWHNKKTVENSDYIITKKFWFIKWLVENDKINWGKVEDIETISCWELTTKDDIDDFFEDAELEQRVTMLLSISLDPIEDLISVLK